MATNAYFRQYYAIHKESQQKRNREKYHRLKDVWKANKTDEEKEILKAKNRENQKRYYDNRKKGQPKRKYNLKPKIMKNPIAVITTNPNLYKDYLTRYSLTEKEAKRVRFLKDIKNVVFSSAINLDTVENSKSNITDVVLNNIILETDHPDTVTDKKRKINSL